MKRNVPIAVRVRILMNEAWKGSAGDVYAYAHVVVDIVTNDTDSSGAYVPRSLDNMYDWPYGGCEIKAQVDYDNVPFAYAEQLGYFEHASVEHPADLSRIKRAVHTLGSWQRRWELFRRDSTEPRGTFGDYVVACLGAERFQGIWYQANAFAPCTLYAPVKPSGRSKLLRDVVNVAVADARRACVARATALGWQPAKEA